MAVLTTNEERKSLLFTAITFVWVLILLLIFHLKNDATIIQELEGGGGGGGDIAVNFGDSDVGMGDNFESTESVRQAPEPVVAKPAEASEILTDESDNAPAIADIKKPIEKPKKPETKPLETPVPKKPTPAKSTQSALDDLLRGTDQSGDGSDKVGGNKGKAYGSTGNRGYDGGGGSGGGTGGGDGDGNGTGQGPGSGSGSGGGSGSGRGTGVGSYELAGRKAINKAKPAYPCNEQGTVVVQISVNASGKVIAATPGYRGTNNTAQCLLQAARVAALAWTFDANPSAPEKQVGKLIFNFKLTD